MKYFLIFLISILIVQDSVAPPVTKEKDEEEQKKKEESEDGFENTMEYHRYLKEVVQALESDPEFREKLEKAEETDILNGKIAHELEYVSHHVRSKLDELKRTELERLRHLAIKEYELENGLDPTHLKIPEHVDHTNPHTFEIDDLKKLIAKTKKDLDEADKQRREQFKEYEMRKAYELEQKLNNMTEEERNKALKEINEMEIKHKEHEPLHHPGSKKQLEEVWEKQDHMENQEFDPRTFFFLHDLDGNGVWDQTELKALFLKELDKLYSEGHPEDDLVERAEELERMREHVIREADLNKDGLISYDEFLTESKKDEFEQDPGWTPLDEQQLYSQEEYEHYKQLKAKEIERAIAKGMSQEYHPAGQLQAGYQQFPSHPNQMPQPAQYQHQVPAQQHYPQQGQYVNQMPPQHGQYNQVPPQQVQYQQMPPQQGQFANQIPVQQQQQFHPNQPVPVHNNINQVPQQNYQSANQQVPVGQNQVPPQPHFQQPQQFNQQPGQQQNQQQHQQLNQQPGQQQNQQHQQFNQQPGQQQNQQQHQQFNQQPGQQQNQQQHQQFNQQPGQQQNQQQPLVNNVNQNQQPVQSNQPSVNAINSNNQQIPVATGQNQQNTQNQVPQQTHEQIASINNAQVHHNSPNAIKT